jgi:hypothetical protein
MSDEPPPSPIFDAAPGGSSDPTIGPDGIATESEKDRIEEARKKITQLLDKQRERPRRDQFYPYLLVRSVVGDRGDRPLGGVFWESPDIWTAPGDPSTTPAVPASPGGTLTAGTPNTIYAHVWNLGRAPVIGAKVEFYWFNPSLAIDGANANLIGYARVDLQPRNLPGCHALVKCNRAWTPAFVNNGHECLIVRVSGIGDPLNSAASWDPRSDRHVGQRNIAVVNVAADIRPLLKSLEASRLRTATIRLSQVGPEAQNAVTLVAPKVVVDPAVETHVLAELRPNGAVVMGPAHVAAPVDVAGPVVAPAIGRIMPHAILRVGGFEDAPIKAAGAKAAAADVVKEPTTVIADGGTVAGLVDHARFLTPGLLSRLKALEPPAANEAQVLRIATYDGETVVGGYTIVVRGG